MFEGFTFKKCSWDIAGRYEVIGSYDKETEHPITSKLTFVIYVEGIAYPIKFALF